MTQHQAIRTSGTDLVIAAQRARKVAKAASQPNPVNTDDVLTSLLKVVEHREAVKGEQVARIVNLMDNSSDSDMATYQRLSAQRARMGLELPKWDKWYRNYAPADMLHISRILVSVAHSA